MKSQNTRNIIAALLMLGTAAMLALNLPGQMSYDSVSQLLQGRTGIYNSWHPPVMAWLLGLFDTLWPGPGLFVIFDAALLLGAWLTLLRLSPRPGWPALLVPLAMLLTPQFLLHQGTAWKDMLFADSAIAAFAALAAAADSNDGRWIWLGLCALLLALAALARQNGIVLLPAAAVALGWIITRRSGWRRGLGYAGVGLLLTLALIATATLALDRHSDGGQGAQAEIQRGQLYDLVGALKASPGLALPVLDRAAPRLSRLMRGDGVRLYSPMLNDTLESSPALIDAGSAVPATLLFAQWEDLLLHHPGLYLAERWTVFRWTVAPPDVSQCHPAFAGIDGDPADLKALGLAPRIRPQDAALAAYAHTFMGTPVLSHLTFLILTAIMLAVLLRRRRSPDIAVAALLAGGLVYTASYFVISIACDYRYLDFVDLAALERCLLLVVLATPNLTKIWAITGSQIRVWTVVTTGRTLCAPVFWDRMFALSAMASPWFRPCPPRKSPRPRPAPRRNAPGRSPAGPPQPHVRRTQAPAALFLRYW